MTPKESRTIAIVCDASADIGYGHFTRCLALGKAFSDRGITVTFLMTATQSIVKDKAALYDLEILSFPDHTAVFSYLMEQISQLPLVIIDHYQIQAEQEKKIYGKAPLLVIDDLCRPHWCNFLVDQTLGQHSSNYKKTLLSKDTRMFLGTEYAMIDPVYKVVKRTQDLTQVLISFGATDIKSATLKVISILEKSDVAGDLIFHIPLSSLCPDIEAIQKKVKTSALKLNLYLDLPNLIDLYGLCGLAIASPGVGLLERICCRLTNISITTADNQAAVAKNFSASGAVLSLGTIEELEHKLLIDAVKRIYHDPGLVKALNEKAGDLLDGRGAARIVDQVIKKAPVGF